MIPDRLEFTAPSGRVLDITRLKSRDIKLEDIAHSLSMICRFNGSTLMFVSVAEHCVRAADLVASKSKKKRVLLHDAAEAYGIGDLITPIKICVPVFSEIERVIVKAIAKKYRLEEDFPHLDYVRNADRGEALAEKRDLMVLATSKKDRDWWSRWEYAEALVLRDKIPRIYPWIPREARDRFLDYAHKIGLK